MVIARKNNLAYRIGLVLMLFGNICLFTPETFGIFYVVAGLAMLLIFGTAVLRSRMRIRIEPCFVYLTVIYALFFLYGICFLRYGEFNWDARLFYYIENLAFYICLKHLLYDRSESDFEKAIIGATGLILVYTFVVEISNLAEGNIRIGDSMSGNVNTFGMALGTLAILLAYVYCMKKQRSVLLLWGLTVATMLLTGSKKTAFYLMGALAVFFFFVRGNKRYTMVIKLGILGCVLILLIMNVPTFYNVIGSRIEDMIEQLFHSNGAMISHSTESRLGMMKEGFRIFLDHPIFGGGERYFATKSIWGYAYSHCNYTEMLCNYGIVGTAIYYVPYLVCIKKISRGSYIEKGMKVLSIALLVTFLVVDWMVVSYCEFPMGYIPILCAFAVIENTRRNQHSVQDTDDKAFMENK